MKYRMGHASRKQYGCNVSGCNRPHYGKGLCRSHWKRLRERGTLLGKKGQGHIDKAGYHRRVINGKVIFEHRRVMESMLGRALLPHETVHHINGDRLDNRPENLELWASRHPRGQRVQDLVAFAREILELYG